jgi:1-acyl-sn-glycerol-3-phosphate acyltransferase
MILKAKHNFLLYNFFSSYAKWKIKWNFEDVNIIGNIVKSNLPVLLLSNHTSWWDGFWAMYLNMKVFQRKFHFMMLEEELRRLWFFNHTGGFSIRKRSKSVIETLNYTEELLRDNNNLVLVFPHGKIHSMHQQNFQFERGIERAIRNLTGKIQIIFMASLVDYHSKPKPSLYIYIDDTGDGDFTIGNLEDRYNAFYRQSVEKQKQLIVEK